MRQVYRIDLTNSYYLRGHIHAPGQHGIEGKLTDVSACGASLVFLTPADPGLEKDEEVELGFQVKGSDGELLTTAVVRSKNVGEALVRYGFEFLDYGGFDDKVPYVLRAVFNRRRAPRVKPEESVPVAIAGDAQAEGQLVDVSTSGIAVEVPFHLAAAIDIGQRLELTLTFPGQRAAVMLAGVVRDRRMAGPAIHLGVEYDEKAPGYGSASQLIEDFVSTRELETGFVPQ